MPQAVPVHVPCTARAAAGHQGAQGYRQTTASGIPISLRELDRVQRRLAFEAALQTFMGKLYPE